MSYCRHPDTVLLHFFFISGDVGAFVIFLRLSSLLDEGFMSSTEQIL